MAKREIDKDSFAEQWQEALDGVEMTPPDGLWDAIDGDLANMQAVKYRKQMVFYRGIAASLALLIVSALLFAWQNDVIFTTGVSGGQLADQVLEADHPALDEMTLPAPEFDVASLQVPAQSQGSDQEETESNSTITTAGLEHTSFTAQRAPETTGNGRANAGTNYIASQETNTAAQQRSATTVVDYVAISTDQLQNTSTDKGIITPQAENTDANVVSDLHKVERTANVLAAASDRPDNVSELEGMNFQVRQILKDDRTAHHFKIEKSDIEQLPVFQFMPEETVASNSSYWIDLNVRGGLFEPNFQPASGRPESAAAFDPRPLSFVRRSSSFAAESATDEIVGAEDLTAGYSYTMGMNFGATLGKSKKWFLLSGLDYGIYEAVTSTDRVLSDGGEVKIALTEQIVTDAIVPEPTGNGFNSLGVELENVELNNSFQFASIPVRVGYQLLDQNLSLSMNAGISTIFYMGNTLKDPDRILNDVRVTREQNTIYRNVNFSAVAGLTIGYRFLDHYLFTLEPVYQRAINSYTRQTSSFSALPENFGVSLGVRVLIK